MSDIGMPAYFCDKTGVWHTLGKKTGVPLRAVHGLDGVKQPVIKLFIGILRNVIFHFISFSFHLIQLRRVALQPELFYKGPST